MKVQKALKETGKARLSTWHDGAYIYLKNNKIYLKGEGGYNKPYSCEVLLWDDWESYHEVKEIRPEKAGELWENTSGGRMFITKRDNELWCTFADYEKCPLDEGHCVVHGKGTWTLLYSPDKEVMDRIKEVEDESVERIETDRFEPVLSEDEINLIGDVFQESIQFFNAQGQHANHEVINHIAKVLGEITKDKP